MSPEKQKEPDEAEFPGDRSGPLRTESLGDAQPFSRVVLEPREQAEKSVELPELKAVLLGPPGSGKSSFLAALQHSLIVDPSDVVLRCVPQAAKSSHASLDSSAIPAHEELTSVSRFYVELAQPSAAVDLVIHDGADDHAPQAQDGNSLSSAWIEGARSAQLLLLCVDASEMQRDYWRLVLDQVIPDLMQRQEDLAAEDSAELRQILPVSQLPRGGTRCLPFRRVLFLLSRADLLFETAQNGHGFLKRMAALEPRHLARSLDPVPQLCSLLGTATVGKVLHALAEDAEVAVGVVSARGLSSIAAHFHVKASAGLEGIAGLSESYPFGVKEALEFLTRGRCTAPVAPLPKSDLRQSSFMRLL